MPKEYTKCVENYIAKGRSKKYAQRRCAISYYKRHGKQPSHSSLSEYEQSLFDAIITLDDAFGTIRKQ